MTSRRGKPSYVTGPRLDRHPGLSTLSVLARATPTRPTLRLTLECDNACVFCCQDGLEDEGPSLDERIEALAASEQDAVTLTGGEPLGVSDIEAILGRLKKSGFSRVGVQSNGALLGDDPTAAARLRDAGLTDVHLSLHGARPEVHDYHTGHPGSFARIGRALETARQAGLDVVCTTVLTRSNQAVLSELPTLLSAAGVKAWCISLPVAAGRAEDAAPRILPRLSVALPYALHALARARRAALPSFLSGAPLCLLGPFAEHALPAHPRAYVAVCDACPSRARCPGVDALYVERLGGRELRSTNAPSGTLPAIASLFVGEGAHAPRGRRSRSERALPVVP